MLRHTFCHLPGIGTATERALWAAGVRDWDDAQREPRLLSRVGDLAPRAAATAAAWAARDFTFFGRLLHGAQAWRWLPDLRGRAVYLDIETTGLSPERDLVTVVACYDGREVVTFVRDDNLTELPSWLLDHDLLVTYNGATFDVPFLRAAFPHLWLPPVHLDLRYPLAALGLRGGLKAIEQATGLGRDTDLLVIDGFAAVLLWQRHETGDARALPTLLRYCAEDVLGLEPLAELVYNRRIADLPLGLPPLATTPRRRCDLPWHPALLAEMGLA
jgi:uncharacterized protein YprB with RNaseH-like and TPR domain